MAELKKEYILKLNSGFLLCMKVRIQRPQTVPLPAGKGIQFEKVDRTRNKKEIKNKWVPRWNKIVRDKKLRAICNEINKLKKPVHVFSSVADPDPGSGAFVTPGFGSGIVFFRIPDPGSRIRIPDPKPIFWELSDNVLGKKFYNSWKIDPNFFYQDPGSGISIPDPQHMGFSLFRFAKRQTEMEGLTQDGVTPTRAWTTNLLQSK